MTKNISAKLKKAIKKLNYRKDSFYIFDEEICKKEVNKFINSFNTFPSIFSYSYKTNYCKPLIKLLSEYNFLSEVVSPFEVEITSLYNIDPSKIIYNGPVKDFESIKYVFKGGGIINADNFNEFDLLIKTARNLNLIPRIGIRISMESKGLPSRFGIEFNYENIKKIKNLMRIYSLDILDLLHVHYPERNINSFKKRIEGVFEIFNIFQEQNIKFKSIDIGGGFPSLMPEEMQKSLGLDKVNCLSEYATVINYLRKKYNLENIPIVFEPGTAIASNSFHLVGNIHSINYKNDYIYVNTDLSKTLIGGLHNNTTYPISILKDDNDEIKAGQKLINKKQILTSFTCVEGDRLKWEHKENININTKDKILISSIGSYSTVFKSPFIRGDIALYKWDGNNLILCKRAQNANDIFKLYEK